MFLDSVPAFTESPHELLSLQSSLHISVCCLDELPKRRVIDVTFRPEFHMAHELAAAFQQAGGIGELGATKEPNIDVGLERIDIGECCVIQTHGRMAIVQQLANIFSASAHDLEPALRDRPQFARMLVHPDVDSWISLEGTWEP
jgi:hypothetical protein